jgi:hypothetical protein
MCSVDTITKQQETPNGKKLQMGRFKNQDGFKINYTN